MLLFYENVIGVAEWSKNQDGTKQPPMVLKVQEDLQSLGFVWECSKVDTQNYLLRQRRQRIWGTADVSRGQDSDEYGKLVRGTMKSLESTVHFPFEETFDLSLPPNPAFLRTDRSKERITRAVESRKSKNLPHTNLFVDCASSASWGTEKAHEISTCLRPTHHVWSTRMERPITVGEMWNCQGLFKSCFPNQQAVERILHRPKEAQDLCGNSFSSTVMQVKFLASLAHSQAWGVIAESHGNNGDALMEGCEEATNLAEALVETEKVQTQTDMNIASTLTPMPALSLPLSLVSQEGKRESEQLPVETQPDKRRRIRGKVAASECPGYPTFAPAGWLSDLCKAAVPERQQSGTKRRRGRPRKDSPPRDPPPVQKKRRASEPEPESILEDDAVPVKKRKGKQGSLSIFSKVKLLNEPSSFPRKVSASFQCLISLFKTLQK